MTAASRASSSSDAPLLPGDRLAELLDLAQSFRNWNRKQLADYIGRDPRNLIPNSGVPKLDLVIRLGEVLEWPVEQVIGFLQGDEASPRPANPAARTFDELDRAASEAYQRGRHLEMIALARAAYQSSKSDEERARAANREAGGWDGLGRSQDACKAIQRGLSALGSSCSVQLLLRSNLANAYYTISNLTEGRGLASDIIDRVPKPKTGCVFADVAHASALYVRGHCYRREMAVLPKARDDTADAAIRDLTHAERAYAELSAAHCHRAYEAIARTCRGGLLELRAARGIIGAREALSELNASLLTLDDTAIVGDMLESHGWWCIFACNVAIRHVHDESERQSIVARFSNKADEIASELDNWALRERILQIDFSEMETSRTIPAIDADDLRAVTGAMGRFPRFRRLGWLILRQAQQASSLISPTN